MPAVPPDVQEWHDGNHKNACGIADMLGVPAEAYAADPTTLVLPLQDYVHSAPLDEFEQADWITLHCDLVAYLADVMIRCHGAAWRTADAPDTPRGYRYVLEAPGRHGSTHSAHRIDPFAVVAAEFREPSVNIVGMLSTAAHELHVCPACAHDGQETPR
ncbi:hypothetical protein EF912_21170 [Streptomyces sp. WAC07061]|uniref:hypothetical protein n=1 Tax=Streptomyces sp. WAC07061 TaxID=2487410 RepID=UPI000F768D3B|nr:hypothetical protein [Streptomyces sp. WAC07061]RSS51081.1 hypothetical protein EF912_21170 [Streptomyces sp. WAC07061]